MAVLKRRLRKHRHALIAIAVFNFVLFFPTLFMARVISPNDVFYNFDPWSQYSPASVFRVQNSLLNDPPTAYLPLMSLLKDAPETFHWNPYVGSGIPGFGSSAAAVLSPFVLLPTLLLPLAWVYSGIIFLKFNLAFLFAYWWLREERLGKRGAAAGALVAAGAGVLAVRWLWQLTNAAALYPLLLVFVRRAFSNRRTPIWVMTLALIAYALSGFPAAMAYGAYVVIAYAMFLAIRLRRLPLMRISEALLATLLALVITAPSLVPFVQLVARTGYLAVREQASYTLSLPASHWISFFAPERLGNPALRNWVGDPALGSLNNYYESTIYLGGIAVVIALLALFRRRTVGRFFWFAAFLVVTASMFGLAGLPRFVGALPGVKYSSLSRLSLVLPVMVAFLVAAGVSWLSSVLRRRSHRAASVCIALLIALIAADLSVFAARFHPYLLARDANVPSTPTIDYLRAQPRAVPHRADVQLSLAECGGIVPARRHPQSLQLGSSIQAAAPANRSNIMGRELHRHSVQQSEVQCGRSRRRDARCPVPARASFDRYPQVEHSEVDRAGSQAGRIDGAACESARAPLHSHR